MSRVKIGTLFQGLLEKSPELARRLVSLGTRRNEHDETDPKSDARGAGKDRKDHMADGLVEKRNITRRQHVPQGGQKQFKKKSGNTESNSRLRSGEPVGRTKATNTPPGSKDGNRFFSGIPENADQFGIPDGSTPLDVIVGVDFGTSLTKVVIRAPYHTGEPTYAVPFGDLAHESLPYFLPTRLYIDDDGHCSLTPVPGASVLIDIKIALLDSPNDNVVAVDGSLVRVNAITVATSYLALTLRYVRSWFLATKRQTFGRRPLRWTWNLGLPATIDDNEILRDIYHQVGKAAWVASRRPGPICTKHVFRAIEDVKYEKCGAEEDSSDFGLVPEVIAEVLGYARSRHRNEGLHLLVDVGASTLDVCAFNLHTEDDEDIFSILTADIGSLGPRRLHISRTQAAKAAVTEQSNTIFEANDPACPIPGDPCGYIPGHESVCEHVTKADEKFKGECSLLLRKTIWDLKKNRDPRSTRWSESLPVFFCGGASAMDMYGSTVTEVGWWLKEHLRSSQGIRRVQLPKPEALEANVDDDNFHRLAVAWGLSIESFNWGTYCRPGEIEDVPPLLKRDIENDLVSKDMV